jgi:hypothetical protein
VIVVTLFESKDKPSDRSFHNFGLSQQLRQLGDWPRSGASSLLKQRGRRSPARLSSNGHTAVQPGVRLSIALVPGNFVVQCCEGPNMMNVRILGIGSFSLLFLLSLFAPVHSQEPANASSSEARSPLSAIAHDFTTWLNHVAGNGAKNHRAGRPSSQLPQTRPASALASNKEWSEFMPSPGASKKKTPTLVQIRD